MHLTEVEGLGGRSGRERSCEVVKSAVGLAAWGEDCGRGQARGHAGFSNLDLDPGGERHPRRGEDCAFLTCCFNFSWNGLGRIRTLPRHRVNGVILLRPEKGSDSASRAAVVNRLRIKITPVTLKKKSGALASLRTNNVRIWTAELRSEGRETSPQSLVLTPRGSL